VAQEGTSLRVQDVIDRGTFAFDYMVEFAFRLLKPAEIIQKLSIAQSSGIFQRAVIEFYGLIQELLKQRFAFFESAPNF
jgi:hypothetical protein